MHDGVDLILWDAELDGRAADDVVSVAAVVGDLHEVRPQVPRDEVREHGHHHTVHPRLVLALGVLSLTGDRTEEFDGLLRDQAEPQSQTVLRYLHRYVAHRVVERNMELAHHVVARPMAFLTSHSSCRSSRPQSFRGSPTLGVRDWRGARPVISLASLRGSPGWRGQPHTQPGVAWPPCAACA